MYILEPVLGDIGGEAELLGILRVYIIIQEQMSKEHSSQEGGDDTDDERYSEALDRTRTEHSQYDTRKE